MDRSWKRASHATVLAVLYLPCLATFSLKASTTGAAAADGSGAIPGRVVEIPARDYRLAFSVKPPVLGECALKIEGSTIKTCSEKFEGEEVFIPYASTGVGVSRVETVDDVITQGMGGIGVSIGLLGLVSAGVKANVAVRTQTNKKQVTFMSSYEVKRGVLTLRNPRPLTEIGPAGAIYLSEIELGGSEMLTVSMEFESVHKKVEVAATITIKILFIKISARMRYVKEKFNTASKTRILFVSSWRGKIDKTFSSLDDAIAEVEKIEEMYVTGPKELKKLKPSDENLHNMYYFAAWKKSPYGENLNRAVTNNDLAVLTEQEAEITAVINQIDEYLERGIWDRSQKDSMEKMKSTLATMSSKISRGIESYYKLTSEQRNSLFDLYGRARAPGYYERKLKSITGY